MAADASVDLTALTADIVSAYVSNNRVETSALAGVIAEVHKALGSAGQPAAAVEPETPKPSAAEIRKSRTPEFLTSFMDGRKYKSLKRHLGTYEMTPDEYRTKFGLPKNYPMVAKGYSAQRSALAKTLGRGRKAAATPEPHQPEAEVARQPEVAPAPKKPSRPKAAKIKEPADAST